MITGELKSKIDSIWNAMWAGGIANPLTVIEQLTYLLFIKRLDEIHTLRESKANRLKKPIEDPVFTPAQNQYRWTHFRDLAPEPLFKLISEKVFPFIKSIGTSPDGTDSTYAQHMRDAIFLFPKASLLANVIDQLDSIAMHDQDTKGDLYEYMLGKIASAGQNGQFRTPRHIIRLMVEMTDPQPADTICDPACGTCGFLVEAAQYMAAKHSTTVFKDAAARQRFSEATFFGYDFDSTMLRIGSMNMLLHGIENPDICYKDSLEETHSTDAAQYTLILANPPFAGSLDYESTAKDLLSIVKTKKTELLFLALFLRLLKTGGRAAIIVPDGVLFGSSKAHKELRRMLVEDQKLDAIVSMPSGVFKPYAGVSTAILFFTKTESGGTDHVWFYDMKQDGFSLDDKRTPQPEKSDLPDILSRWQTLKKSEIKNQQSPVKNQSPSEESTHKRTDQSSGTRIFSPPQCPESTRKRTDQSFLVPRADLAANDYDLSLNRYKEVEYEAIHHDTPQEILTRLNHLETEIQQGQKELEELIG